MKREHQNYFIKRYVEGLQIKHYFEFIEDETLFEPLKIKEMIVSEQGCVSLVLLSVENEFFLYYPFEEDTLEVIEIPKDEAPLVFKNAKESRKLFAYTDQTLALLYDQPIVKLFKHYKTDVAIEIKLEAKVEMIVVKGGKFYLLLENKKMVILESTGKILETKKPNKQLFAPPLPKIQKEMKISTFGIDCSDNLWILEEESHHLYHFFKTKFYKTRLQAEVLTFDSFDDYTSWSNLYLDWNVPEGTKVDVAFGGPFTPTPEPVEGESWDYILP